MKPLLVALLALVALAALTSTAASAATCKKGALEAEHKVLCVEGKQVGSPTEIVTTAATFTQKAGTSAVINVPQGEWSVNCARVQTAGGPVIKSGGSGNVQIQELQFLFSECKVLLRGKEKPECRVEGPGTYPLSGSLALPESIELTDGGSFGSFNITGCLLNNNYTINGSQVCSLKQPEIEAVAKELVCEPKNSHLKFSGGVATPPTLQLEGNLELAGTSKGKKYSITK